MCESDPHKDLELIKVEEGFDELLANVMADVLGSGPESIPEAIKEIALNVNSKMKKEIDLYEDPDQ